MCPSVCPFFERPFPDDKLNKYFFFFFFFFFFAELGICIDIVKI